ncbi:hypothetical protein ACHAWF_012735 [Thalassiosira exigua]
MIAPAIARWMVCWFKSLYLCKAVSLCGRGGHVPTNLCTYCVCKLVFSGSFEKKQDCTRSFLRY